MGGGGGVQNGRGRAGQVSPLQKGVVKVVLALLKGRGGTKSVKLVITWST